MAGELCWMQSAAKLFNGLCPGSGSEIVAEQKNCRTNKVVMVIIRNDLILPSIDSCFSSLLYQRKLFSYYCTAHYSRYSL